MPHGTILDHMERNGPLSDLMAERHVSILYFKVPQPVFRC